MARHPAVPGSGLCASVGVAELDDCAVIPFTNGTDLVIGSDFVRGENFKLALLGLLSAQDVGYYLMGANASDLAAMGARPIGATVIYRYPPQSSDSHHSELMSGIAIAAQDFGMPILGGDSGEYEESVLSATAVGVCPSGKALLRSGGRPGDVLFLTGAVGVAGAAFRYFTTCAGTLTPEEESCLLAPWRRVKPALAQGAALVERGISGCAIDTSDGLKTACRQLAAASNVDVVLNETALPYAPVVADVARLIGCDPVALTCGDSVDFRLLFSASPANRIAVLEMFSQNGWDIFEIGHMSPSRSGEAKAWLSDGRFLREIPGIEKS